ncbi:MAG: CRTAC1 family protein [Pirellulaceae bacterium]|nr:CRTAC1 family protein [Pirellulaceae bacterium]
MSAAAERPNRFGLWFAGAATAAVVAVCVFFAIRSNPPTAVDTNPGESAVDPNQTVLAAREQLDQTIWKEEVAAQEFEQPFVKLWDQLRESSTKFDVLGSFGFETIALRGLGEPTTHDHAIEALKCDGEAYRWTPAQWRTWLSGLREAGYRIVQTEWHHSRFETSPEGRRSTVSIVLDVANESEESRFSIKGPLVVHWKPESESPEPAVANIDASQLTVYRRKSEATFDEVEVLRLKSPQRGLLAAYDLDGDGLSELISPTNNSIYWNRGEWVFESRSLFESPPEKPLFCGVFADFTGDGRVDFLGAAAGALLLYVADEQQAFSTPPQSLAEIGETLEDPMVMTAGDIDGDGDVDVWLGQYKRPYIGGQMPTPYYDAKDGFNAYLLTNDGQGEFQDATLAAGLGEKRNRRTYSASFVDLDGDVDLDLVVVSDFSGVDVYENDGSGKFRDVTTAVDQRHAFGMSLTVGDYNLDSQIDFFMVGMSSTTANRLHQLGVGREEYTEHQTKRPEMGYGNRLYLTNGKQFQQASFNADVARTGWSWGSTTLDFDNDGDRDLFVANGNQSGRTAKDYCTTFWRHDIYTGSSEYDPKLDSFFKSELNFATSGLSWNGFEHNALLMNQNGESFLNVGFLAGVASEFDSRNVLSDDLDGDGAVDLVVVGRPRKQVAHVHILRNKRIDEAANWIGLRLEGCGHSAAGARIAIETDEGKFVEAVVSGDSYASQHAPVVHWGLGAQNKVKSIDIQWPDGSIATLKDPEINRYHRVKATSPSAEE